MVAATIVFVALNEDDGATELGTALQAWRSWERFVGTVLYNSY